jgi:hypothetical protein
MPTEEQKAKDLARFEKLKQENLKREFLKQLILEEQSLKQKFSVLRHPNSDTNFTPGPPLTISNPISNLQTGPKLSQFTRDIMKDVSIGGFFFGNDFVNHVSTLEKWAKLLDAQAQTLDAGAKIWEAKDLEQSEHRHELSMREIWLDEREHVLDRREAVLEAGEAVSKSREAGFKVEKAGKKGIDQDNFLPSQLQALPDLTPFELSLLENASVSNQDDNISHLDSAKASRDLDAALKASQEESPLSGGFIKTPLPRPLFQSSSSSLPPPFKMPSEQCEQQQAAPSQSLEKEEAAKVIQPRDEAESPYALTCALM